jgi:hypothetical protein
LPSNRGVFDYEPQLPVGTSGEQRKRMNIDRNWNSANFAIEKKPQTSLRTTPARGLREIEIEQLKDRLVADLLGITSNLAMNRHLVQAANEAAALAWLTPVPLLLLPVLIEEKVKEAQVRLERQKNVHHRSQQYWAITKPLLPQVRRSLLLTAARGARPSDEDKVIRFYA